MEPLGEGLRQPVGHCLGQDRGVVVVVGVVSPAEGLAAVAGGAGEGADVVGPAARPRGHEVGQGVEHVLPLPLPLLAERVYPAELGRAALVGEQNDVVALGVGGEEAVHPLGHERALPRHLVEHQERVAVELPGLLAHDRVGEDRRILTLELP